MKQISAIANKLKYRRLSLEMKQSELAKKVGISPAAMCKFESGQKVPRLKTLLKIIKVLSLELKIE